MCKRSDSIKNLAVALVKFNSEVSKIEKDSSNPHFRNKYASLDNIIDEIRPILTKNGLSVIQMPGGDGDMFSMTTMLLHESGEWIESDPIKMRPVKNDPQGIGSCTTYARRYSLAAFLSLNTGEDDDGNGASGLNDSHQPQTSQQTRQPQQPIQTHQQQSTPPTAHSSGPQAMVSDAQVGYMKKMQREKQISDDDFKRMVAEHSEGSLDVKALTKKQASEFINFLTNYAV